MNKRKQIIIYIVLLLAAFFAMAKLKRCSSVDYVVRGEVLIDTLNVGIEYSPISFYMDGDTICGFNYDLIKLLANRGGFEIKFYPLSSVEAGLNGLNNQLYDILLAQIPKNSEMMSQYLFTEPLYIDKQVLLQRIDSLGLVVVNSQLDLAGKSVYVIEGTSARERLNSLADEIGGDINVISDDKLGQRELFQEVSDSVIDYAIVSYQSARRFVNDSTNVDLSTDISFSQFQSWVLSVEDSLLCDTINSLIIELKDTPTMLQLYKRYDIDE